MAGSMHGASVQGRAQGMQVSARLDGSTSPESPPTCLAVDITMEGFDEAFFIYEGDLSVSIPLTCTAGIDTTALEVKVRYQACSDQGCFMPRTVELSLPVRG